MDRRINILESELLDIDYSVVRGFDETRQNRIEQCKSNDERTRKSQRETYTAGVLIDKIRPEDCMVGYYELGKPFFSKKNVDDTVPDNRRFSVTHSNGRVFIVWSDEFDVGCDYESGSRHISIASARRICTEPELRYLGGLRNDEAKADFLIKLYTRKEAITKLSGKGILQRFSEIDGMMIETGGAEAGICVETMRVHEGYLSIAYSELK